MKKRFMALGAGLVGALVPSLALAQVSSFETLTTGVDLTEIKDWVLTGAAVIVAIALVFAGVRLVNRVLAKA